MTAWELVPKASVAVPISGLTKGSSVVMMNTEIELVIFSTRPERPGMRSMVTWTLARGLTLFVSAHLDLLHNRVSEGEDLPNGRMQLLGRHLGWVKTSRLTSSHVANVVHVSAEVVTCATWQIEEQLSKRGARVRLALLRASSVAHLLGQVRDRGLISALTKPGFMVTHLTEMICRFTHQGVDEIGTTESTRYQGVNAFSVRRIDLDVLTDMREDVLVAQRDESKLAEVTVSGEILSTVSDSIHSHRKPHSQRMQGLTEEQESLILVILVSARLVLSAEVDALLERAADKRLGSVPVSALCVSAMPNARSPTRRDVILHSVTGRQRCIIGVCKTYLGSISSS